MPVGAINYSAIRLMNYPAHFYYITDFSGKQEVIETFRRNALAKNLEEEVGKDRLVLVEGRSRR